VSAPHLPVTPPEVLASTVDERVVVAGRGFVVRRPADPDALLDHPATHAAYARDQYMPYWCSLWPSSYLLAEAVLARAWPAGTRAIELGCGLGLPGLAALAAGMEVTFSDYDGAAVEFARRNADLNGFAAHRGAQVDWRHPPPETFPLVLGADLLYEQRLVVTLAGALDALVAPGGEAWVADQGRAPAGPWELEMERRGWVLERQRAAWRHFEGTVYRARRGGVTAAR
jgi:predicted nicotinamide N-methyase